MSKGERKRYTKEFKLNAVYLMMSAAYVCHLQQFSDFFTTCVLFRGTILSCHNNYLQCGASILHHIGGLHKVWDGLK